VAEKTTRNSIQEAANKADVPFATFKLWLLENVPATPDRWSKWNSGDEAIPEKYVIQFLRDELARLKAGQSAEPPPAAAPALPEPPVARRPKSHRRRE